MILTIDIGTSSMKGGIISPSGDLLDYHSVHFADHFQSRNAEEWKNGFGIIMKNLTKQPIEAVAMSGNGPTLVPLKKDKTPAGEVLFWKDYHPVERKGRSYYLPKIAWLMQNCKDVYSDTDVFLSPPEYLSYLLTDRPTMFCPTEAYPPFIWTEEDIDSYGIAPGKIPPLVQTSRLAGEITAEAASEYGLMKGIPVFAGGSDFTAALIGTGAMTPGTTCDRAGSSEGINYCTDDPGEYPDLRTLPHARSGLFNVSAILFSTGALFEWYRKITGQKEYSYEKTLGRIAEIPLEKDLPFFFPEKTSGGMREFADNTFYNLHPSHSRWDMGMSVLLAIGFAVNEGIERIESHLGKIESLRISGGQGKNSVWNQLKSNITGKPLQSLHVQDAELLGNACAAAVGLNLYPDIEKASNEMVRIEQTFFPEMKQHSAYQEKARIYRKKATELGF